MNQEHAFCLAVEKLLQITKIAAHYPNLQNSLFFSLL